MMMNDNNSITLVTAFFPIGRGNWSDSTRSDQKYLDYFSYWARIYNNLIVYTTSEFSEKIKNVREKYGRDNTTVITVDDYASVDSELLGIMRSVAESYPSYSLYPDKPEVKNAEYDYVMALKYWCMQQASKLAKTKYLAWIDFGFDHGGTLYKESSFFDMEWEYPFEKDVTLFAVKKPNDLPVFDIVQRTDTFIQGDCLVTKTDYARNIYSDVREQYLHLLYCGMIDDDQIALQMCARWKPEHYGILPSSWFSQLRDYSDKQSHANTVVYGDDEKKVSCGQRYGWVKHCFRYCIHQFRRLCKVVALA